MIEITVYGAEETCPSCIHAPSSRETYEWLKAALQRIYDETSFSVRYVDIYNPESPQDKCMAQRVMDEDLWYPVVIINRKIISEGNPHLRSILEALDDLGLPKQE